MTPRATELAAEHFQTRRSITPEQWKVIEREARAHNVSFAWGDVFNQNLARLFEIEARLASGDGH